MGEIAKGEKEKKKPLGQFLGIHVKKAIIFLPFFLK